MVSARARRIAMLLGLLSTACPMTTPTPPRPTTPVGPTPGARPPVTPPAVVDPVLQVASHGFHTCAVRASGTVLCWGKNTYGQLGDGTRVDTPHAVHVAGLRDAVEVAVGVDFSCARRKSGAVSCWGNDQDGQLGGGKGGRPGVFSLAAQPVFGLRDAVQLSAGDYHACARTRDGAVRCWGNAENGQLGSDTQRVFASPRTIPEVAGTKAIASGANHVCAVDARGKVLCWGRNTEGQLGDGNSGSRVRAVEVKGIVDAVDVASGANFSCARRRAGQIACWGDNASGQLGAGARGEPKRYEPVAMAGLAQIVELALGGSHACARQGNGRVVCWGANDQGQLGAAGPSRTAAVAVRGLEDAVSLGMGTRHGCAARKRGDAVCWGTNEFGALGPRPLK
jgi:alpha-tubulin suppressor-like RCC1 family protein